MFITRTRVTLAVTAVATVALAGCGGDNGDAMPGMEHGTSSMAATSSTQARIDFNDTDVSFLQMMYPHHAQAVDMAKLAPSRSRNQQLLALAAAIEQAQAPEMQRITTLLQSFGKPAPTAGDGHMGHSMPGMMSAEQMSALQGATGPDFDRQWLTMMIEHHSGAIAMAETESTGGTNTDAQALARAIVANQQAEIEQMRTMLGNS
ncbi:DUF305 domain-containing protein [Nocardia sp. NBC_01730]|uniref:DUF305 domain-containing protein n=1 Tax=Nocardia sp. NBC_01730 TaxID=2975998 RepID=UPI002E0FE132|nr:DUF305 domain-containing protein [Nocardia sp. NBC_01730]